MRHNSLPSTITRNPFTQRNAMSADRRKCNVNTVYSFADRHQSDATSKRRMNAAISRPLLRDPALCTSGLGNCRIVQTVSFLTSNLAVLSCNVKKWGCPRCLTPRTCAFYKHPRWCWWIWWGGGRELRVRVQRRPSGRGLREARASSVTERWDPPQEGASVNRRWRWVQ